MAKSQRYTPEHAESGLNAKFPDMETWPNQFPSYEIIIDIPSSLRSAPRPGYPISVLCGFVTCPIRTVSN